MQNCPFLCVWVQSYFPTEIIPSVFVLLVQGWHNKLWSRNSAGTLCGVNLLRMSKSRESWLFKLFCYFLPFTLVSTIVPSVTFSQCVYLLSWQPFSAPPFPVSPFDIWAWHFPVQPGWLLLLYWCHVLYPAHQGRLFLCSKVFFYSQLSWELWTTSHKILLTTAMKTKVVVHSPSIHNKFLLNFSSLP